MKLKETLFGILNSAKTTHKDNPVLVHRAANWLAWRVELACAGENLDENLGEICNLLAPWDYEMHGNDYFEGARSTGAAVKIVTAVANLVGFENFRRAVVYYCSDEGIKVIFANAKNVGDLFSAIGKGGKHDDAYLLYYAKKAAEEAIRAGDIATTSTSSGPDSAPAS